MAHDGMGRWYVDILGKDKVFRDINSLCEKIINERNKKFVICLQHIVLEVGEEATAKNRFCE